MLAAVDTQSTSNADCERGFGEDEVKSLCKTFHLNNQEIHLDFVEYKGSGGRRIYNKFNKLLAAVDTQSTSNADCERGFSAVVPNRSAAAL